MAWLQLLAESTECLKEPLAEKIQCVNRTLGRTGVADAAVPIPTTFVLLPVGLTMLSEKNIKDTVQQIVLVAHSPSKVILFGSYARGDAVENSDLDLIVVERDIADQGAEQIRLVAAIGILPVDVDVLVYSEDEFEKRKNWCFTPVYWAHREGKVLHDGNS